MLFQHLLVMRGDSMIIKHWREDWIYEDNQILAFDKNDTWKRVILSANDIKEKWVHVDGKHQWQSNSDSPLPRCEYTERDDYNVLHRGNTLYLTKTGCSFLHLVVSMLKKIGSLKRIKMALKKLF